MHPLATQLKKLNVGGFNILSINKKSTWQTRWGYRKFRRGISFCESARLNSEKQKGFDLVMWLLSLSQFHKVSPPFFFLSLSPFSFNSPPLSLILFLHIYLACANIAIVRSCKHWLIAGGGKSSGLVTKTSSTKSMPLKEKLNLFRVPQSPVI